MASNDKAKNAQQYRVAGKTNLTHEPNPRHIDKPIGGESPDEKYGVVITPENEGETSVEGAMPVPESDDDVDQMAADVGLYEESNPDPANPSTGPENPHEVNVAEEIEEAEEDLKES